MPRRDLEIQFPKLRSQQKDRALLRRVVCLLGLKKEPREVCLCLVVRLILAH